MLKGIDYSIGLSLMCVNHTWPKFSPLYIIIQNYTPVVKINMDQMLMHNFNLGIQPLLNRTAYLSVLIILKIAGL